MTVKIKKKSQITVFFLVLVTVTNRKGNKIYDAVLPQIFETREKAEQGVKGCYAHDKEMSMNTPKERYDYSVIHVAVDNLEQAKNIEKLRSK